jgi:hypothetical protein
LSSAIITRSRGRRDMRPLSGSGMPSPLSGLTRLAMRGSGVLRSGMGGIRSAIRHSSKHSPVAQQ